MEKKRNITFLLLAIGFVVGLITDHNFFKPIPVAPSPVVSIVSEREKCEQDGGSFRIKDKDDMYRYGWFASNEEYEKAQKLPKYSLDCYIPSSQTEEKTADGSITHYTDEKILWTIPLKD